ncbi:hypothetical protein D3C84_786180 [compost metagenome]
MSVMQGRVRFLCGDEPAGFLLRVAMHDTALRGDHVLPQANYRILPTNAEGGQGANGLWLREVGWQYQDGLALHLLWSA